MPTKTKDYPIYTYDEPAVYKEFTGGINTDPSNEHLLDSELRDCVNMTYLSGALVKRKGAKKLCDISCNDNLTNIQGIFLFTYRITYIIIAADGKLYQGVYNDEATITLTRLQIERTKTNVTFAYDEEDVFSGVEEKHSSDILGNTNHEGFIQTFFKNLQTKEEFEKNERGSYFDVTSGAINVGDVFEETDSLYVRRYLCIKDFEKTFTYPSDLEKWEIYGDGESFSYVQDGETITKYADQITPSEIAQLNEYGLYQFDIKDLRQWTTDDIVYFEGRFYKCIAPHYNRFNSIMDPELFANISNLSSTNFIECSYLLFQNYRKVEAATLGNKLYIATGTRIVEIYLQNNELKARPIPPYLCNYTEITKIGYNYMSPYPELAVASQKNTVTTSITGLKVQKTITGRFLLTPVMNIQIGDDVKNYYFKWEKFINGNWYTVIPFSTQKAIIASENGGITIEKKDYSSLEVDDADQYIYRCTFAKSFELETTVVKEWSVTDDYRINDYVSVGAHVYRCIKQHTNDKVTYVNNEFDTEAYPSGLDVDGNYVVSENKVQYWVEVFDLQIVPYIYSIIDEEGRATFVYTTTYDYIINQADGEYFGSATSVLFDNNISVNDNFTLIHSCTKVLADGNKLLFYGDRYNSGQWFKTIINNPGYVTDRGCLSFKTNKNESVIKVVPFQGNLIVFANAETVGGSIHLVSGNGDDYDDQSGYYSPYQRKTINASISSSNADSIQICDNIIVFKYFNRVYYINASDLNNDTVKVTPCNDRILNNEGKVKIPWDDDDCISEVTNIYYALIWKEKYALDDNGELMLVHPGMRVKMYYKMSSQLPDGSYAMPWLRDESEVFNTQYIIYVRGKALYLYHNVLVSFDENYYKDINETYPCIIHCKAVDLNYESFLKLIDNVLVGFHRNQYNKIDLSVIIKNEAGHILLDNKSKRFAANDLGALRVDTKYSEDLSRIGSTIQDSKMFLTINKFPCLTADTTVKAITDGSFTLSSLTYSYTTIDAPDSNPSDIYKNIIRPED